MTWIPSVVLRWIDRTFVRSLHATAEGLYLPSQNGAPSGAETQLAERTEAYIRALPPTIRVQLFALYVAIDVFAPVLAPFGWRLSSRPPDARLAAVVRWRASRIYPLRLLGNAVHAQLQMLYLAHPDVMRFIGEYKPVAYPDDAYPMMIKPIPEAS